MCCRDTPLPQAGPAADPAWIQSFSSSISHFQPHILVFATTCRGDENSRRKSEKTLKEAVGLARARGCRQPPNTQPGTVTPAAVPTGPDPGAGRDPRHAPSDRHQRCCLQHCLGSAAEPIPVCQVYIPRIWLGTNVSAGPAVATPAEASVPRTRVCSKGRGGHGGVTTGSSLLTTAKLLKRSSFFFFFKENLLEL